ncbi:MAG: hypothetical protein ACREPM_24185, partial [Gemmatimonadaceae bacterium]
MPHFYRSPDEFAAAAQSAVAGAAPKRPVAVLACEVDASDDLAPGKPSSESRIGAVAEIIRHALRSDDSVGRVGDQLVMV